MMHQHLLTGNRHALRESVLLGNAWRITLEWLVHGLVEELYFADAVGDLL
jgi:hypothetical protein